MPRPVHVLFAFGTRPEAIKLAPVIGHLGGRPGDFRVTVCLTSQHRELLRQVTEFFRIRDDVDLDIMVHDQTLEHITAAVVTRMRDVFEEYRPDILLVQGDTTTVFAASVAAYYRHIAVGHVEAGLRTGNKYSPFPEEMNRLLTSAIADLHFAPTRLAAENLAREGKREDAVFVTGNTVIDALFLGRSILGQWDEERRWDLLRQAALPEEMVRDLRGGKTRLITVTAHRRESFGAPFEHMCEAMRELVHRYPDLVLVYPVHPNPNVRGVVERVLGSERRVHLIEPVRYEQLLFLMDHSVLLLTDSGGIQEEGPSLRKPVLVMREVTERPEGIDAGVARLVGTHTERIVAAVSELLDDPKAYEAMIGRENPYGDGHASERIAEIILSRFGDA